MYACPCAYMILLILSSQFWQFTAFFMQKYHTCSNDKHLQITSLADQYVFGRVEMLWDHDLIRAVRRASRLGTLIRSGSSSHPGPGQHVLGCADNVDSTCLATLETPQASGHDRKRVGQREGWEDVYFTVVVFDISDSMLSQGVLFERNSIDTRQPEWALALGQPSAVARLVVQRTSGNFLCGYIIYSNSLGYAKGKRKTIRHA